MHQVKFRPQHVFKNKYHFRSINEKITKVDVFISSEKVNLCHCHLWARSSFTCGNNCWSWTFLTSQSGLHGFQILKQFIGSLYTTSMHVCACACAYSPIRSGTNVWKSSVDCQKWFQKQRRTCSPQMFGHWYYMKHCPGYH